MLSTIVRLSPVLLLFSLLAAAGQDTQAQAHANFSGRWRMDKERSDFAKFTKPDIVVRVIEQRDPDMNVHMVQTTGERTTTVDVVYKTDGAPSTNIVNGRDATSKGFWDGAELVIRTNMKTAKNEDEVIEDRYALSTDGSTLTTTSHVVTDKGEATLVMVSNKEKVQ